MELDRWPRIIAATVAVGIGSASIAGCNPVEKIVNSGQSINRQVLDQLRPALEGPEIDPSSQGDK